MLLDKFRESAPQWLAGDNSEGAMQKYEIRILSGGETHLVVTEAHLSDLAAIRAGKKYAFDNPFEVWRDLECVHRKVSAEKLPRS